MTDGSVPRDTVRRSLAALAIGALALIVVMALFWQRGGRAASSKTAEFTLVASGTSANGGFNFNGYAKGGLAITVPVGWKVVVHYRNGSNLRHSLDVIPYAGKQPDKAPAPVFAGASTKDLVDGIGVGQEETLTFAAQKAGKYEFLCGVLGHAQAGMWDFLIVSPTAKGPSARPASAVALKTK